MAKINRSILDNLKEDEKSGWSKEAIEDFEKNGKKEFVVFYKKNGEDRTIQDSRYKTRDAAIKRLKDLTGQLKGSYDVWMETIYTVHDGFFNKDHEYTLEDYTRVEDLKESTDYLLDRNYSDIMRELRNILKLFGLDERTFDNKLDDGEVTQTDFDSALNMLIDATGRTTEFSKDEINKMKETTDDLIYTYTESFLNDMWNEEPDPNISDEEMNRTEEVVRRFSEGVTQYLKDEIEFI